MVQQWRRWLWVLSLLCWAAPIDLAPAAEPPRWVKEWQREPGVVFLITEGEATLPPSPAEKGPPPDSSGGPRIEVRNPAGSGELTPPFELDVRFAPGPGGGAVKMDSFQIFLVALWEIDLTPRVKPYLKADEKRLYIPKAQVPSGSHQLRLSIADEKGNLSSRVVRVVVK